MMKGNPQFSGDILVNQTRSELKRRQLGWVRQDNNAPQRVSIASGDAYPVKRVARSRQLKTNSDRAKKHSTKRQTVIAVGWIKKPISDEIDRIALDSGLSRSKTIATLLDEAVHQKLHIQHAILLGPIIQQAIAEEREKDRTRIAGLLVQNTVITGQVKYLLTNLLGRSGFQQKVTADDLYKILDWSKRKARETAIRRGKHTEKLLAAIGEWLDAEGREEDEPTTA
jgi:hypothetical protein